MMTRSPPAISVVIPTHNRCTYLRRALDALQTQTYPMQRVEVVVVADGCTDETVEALQHYEASFGLRVLEQPGQGAAAARNLGAAHARGRLLLFLDDDVEPTPGLVKAHVQAHQLDPSRAVMGPYPPVLPRQLDFFGIELRNWWETKFHTMQQHGYRYSYRDLLSGNLSLAAEVFTRVGGFDPTFRSCGGEDYEFGLRLIQVGVPFAFVPGALAHHHETTDLDRSLRRRRQEGYADVVIGRRHPELRTTLPLAQFEAPCSRLGRILRALAFLHSAAGDVFVAQLRSLLNPLERAHLRGRWHRLYGHLRDYWYWRGVIDELGTRRMLASFLEGGTTHSTAGSHEIELDLRQGLEATEHRLDAEQPTSARIRYGQQPVGRIPPQPGAERLCGTHLRHILATKLSSQLILALTMEAATNGATEASGPVPVEDVHPSDGTCLPTEPGQLSSEWEQAVDERGQVWQ